MNVTSIKITPLQEAYRRQVACWFHLVVRYWDFLMYFLSYYSTSNLLLLFCENCNSCVCVKAPISYGNLNFEHTPFSCNAIESELMVLIANGYGLNSEWGDSKYRLHIFRSLSIGRWLCLRIWVYCCETAQRANKLGWVVGMLNYISKHDFIIQNLYKLLFN